MTSSEASSAPSGPASRIEWVDYAKGIGIFLVVVGHTLRGLVSAGILAPSRVLEDIDSWIYAFHMPLFFFLAGLFFERSLAKGARRFVADKLGTVAYPYLLWSLLQGLIQAGLSSMTSHAADVSQLWRILYRPEMQFWFLYTLFLILLLCGALRSVGVPRTGLLLIGAALYAAIPFEVPMGPWGMVYMVRRSLIYFVLGSAAGGPALTERLARASSGGLVALATAGYAGVGLALAPMSPKLALALVPLWAALGIAATCAAGERLARAGGGGLVRLWGERSLQIYVAHTIASAGVRIALVKVLRISGPPAHIAAGVTAGLGIPILFDRLCRRVGFPYAFTLPPSRAAAPQEDGGGVRDEK
jgi:fucose 4-O-acetylase-like acetyltransferase